MKSNELYKFIENRLGLAQGRNDEATITNEVCNLSATNVSDSLLTITTQIFHHLRRLAKFLAQGQKHRQHIEPNS